jgi:predicted nucleic acid-binding Zn ribbon protein
MNPEPEASDARCLVCDKNVEHGEGFCRIQVEEKMISLCCPLCVETYNKDKDRYAAKLHARLLGFLGDSFSIT